jgi:hypothetical protein
VGTLGLEGTLGLVGTLVQRQARKGTKAGKKRYKGRQEKVQRQARKVTKAG